MEKIKINFVCDKFIDELKSQLNNKVLDLDLLKYHIENCEVCSNGYTKITKDLLSYVKNNPMIFFKILKQ